MTPTDEARWLRAETPQGVSESHNHNKGGSTYEKQDRKAAAEFIERLEAAQEDACEEWASVSEYADAKFDKVTEALEALQSALSEFNDLNLDQVNSKIEEFNNIAQEAQTWANDLGEKLQETFDEKSERFQESSRGEQLSERADRWYDWSADEVDEFKFEEVEIDDIGDDHDLDFDDKTQEMNDVVDQLRDLLDD